MTDRLIDLATAAVQRVQAAATTGQLTAAAAQAVSKLDAGRACVAATAHVGFCFAFLWWVSHPPLILYDM